MVKTFTVSCHLPSTLWPIGPIKIGEIALIGVFRFVRLVLSAFAHQREQDKPQTQFDGRVLLGDLPSSHYRQDYLTKSFACRQ